MTCSSSCGSAKARQHLLQYGEHGLNSVGFGGLGCTSQTLSPFLYPNIIDISNERRPRIVATLVQEIGEPARCASALNFDRPAFPRNTPDLTVSPPVVRAGDGEIWFNSLFSGLQVVKFAPGVYPFESSLACTGEPDYLFAQYNPGIDCGGN